MNRIIKTILALTLILSALTNFAQQNNPAFTGPEKGSLVIVGGGRLGADIWARFIELAGGPNARIVVIPTAGEDSALTTGRSFEKELLQNLGVQHVTVLHTRDP